MQRLHLTEEFYKVLQRSRNFCSNPGSALETKGNISPACFSHLPVRSALSGSYEMQPNVKH